MTTNTVVGASTYFRNRSRVPRKAHHDIELGLLVIEQKGLGDGVATWSRNRRGDLLVVADTYRILGTPPILQSPETTEKPFAVRRPSTTLASLRRPMQETRPSFLYFIFPANSMISRIRGLTGPHLGIPEFPAPIPFPLLDRCLPGKLPDVRFLQLRLRPFKHLRFVHRRQKEGASPPRSRRFDPHSQKDSVRTRQFPVSCSISFPSLLIEGVFQHLPKRRTSAASPTC